jgi:surfactin synthase thioesterase subunit
MHRMAYTVQEPSQSRPLLFIGHSLGGLVIKEVCMDTNTHRSRKVRRMLTSRLAGYMQAERGNG